jgi:hypothetical protein
METRRMLPRRDTGDSVKGGLTRYFCCACPPGHLVAPRRPGPGFTDPVHLHTSSDRGQDGDH